MNFRPPSVVSYVYSGSIQKANRFLMFFYFIYFYNNCRLLLKNSLQLLNDNFNKNVRGEDISTAH